MTFTSRDADKIAREHAEFFATMPPDCTIVIPVEDGQLVELLIDGTIKQRSSGEALPVKVGDLDLMVDEPVDPKVEPVDPKVESFEQPK